MQNQSLLTIAIPTYNGGKTISDMLRILLPQCDERVEVIISNNASTDDTEKKVQPFMEKYPFIKYVCNEKNIGPDSNFLQCMEMASGKYTLLLSDDDIFIEDRLQDVLDFLENNGEMSLVFLNVVQFWGKYIDRAHCKNAPGHIYDDKNAFVAKDKKEFMHYVGYYLGFLSTFICLTEAFRSIPDAGKYKGTYWLQSYLHVLCSRYGEQRLGVIETPCVGQGCYFLILKNYVGIFCVQYRNLLDFAIQHGFDKKQIDRLFIKLISTVVPHMMLKEKASEENPKIDYRLIFEQTKRYPQAWIKIYPFILAPRWLCKFIVWTYGKLKGIKSATVNRPGDVSS